MRTLLLSAFVLCAICAWPQEPLAASGQPQTSKANKLSVHWEELTSADFRDGITRAQGTCLLPFGIMEKHGPHLPLGNDLLDVRFVALNSAQQEYAVVFPEYYFGQIFEAKHQPGTVAYSAHLQLELLQETTNEMARNGCKKIIIVNGHGGNNSLLPFFAQSQLDAPHDYVVYVLNATSGSHGGPAHKTDAATDLHAGERETALSMVARPDLVHQDRAKQESGADQARLKLPDGVYTGIWWYARFPNHYAGDGAAATQELGQFEAQSAIDAIVRAIRAVKADQDSLRLQNEFYERSKQPLGPRNGSIVGFVFDRKGRPMPGVVVLAENKDTGFIKTTTTSADGAYTFSDVPPAEGYKITAARMDGHPIGEPFDHVIVHADEKVEVSNPFRESKTEPTKPARQ